MIDPITIGAGAALVGQGINAWSQARTNKRGERFAREMWDKQGDRELQYWNMQNAYNDPSAQMQRLKDAGLNPNLVYGSGSAATQAAPLSPKSTSQPVFKAPQTDLGSVVQQAMMMKQINANIARTEAETRAIDSRTVSQDFRNRLNDAIGIDAMMSRYNDEANSVRFKTAREMFDYDAWVAGSFAGRPTDDPSSPLAAAYRAGAELAVENLKNASALGDIRRFESVIKQFEANLAKEGISPNSPWFVKILGDLLIKAMPSIQSFNGF